MTLESDLSQNVGCTELTLKGADSFQCSSMSETDKTEKPHQKSAILVALTYANFWTAACMSLQAPFFPNEAEHKGATPTEYGFVFGVFELAVMIMSPVFGKLIPRLSPKFLATSGVLIEGASCAIFGALDIIPAGNIYIIMAFVVRIIEGIGAAAVITASFTIVAVEFSESVATTFSLMETAFGLGVIVGPTIGGALFELGGFALPFTTCGGLLFAGSLLFAVLLPRADNSSSLPPRDFKSFILHTGTITYVLTFVIALIILGFNTATLEPHLRQFKLRPIVVGLIFISCGGVYALTTPIFGRISDKGVKTFYVSAFGHLSVCLGLLFIGPVPFLPIKTSLWLIILSLAAIGLGISAKLVSAFAGLLKDTLSRGFPNDVSTFSMVSALFSTTSAAGAFIGPSIGGYLLDSVGYEKSTGIMLAVEGVFLAYVIVYQGVQYCLQRSQNPESAPLILEGTRNGE